MPDPLSLLLQALAPYFWLLACAAGVTVAGTLLKIPAVKGWVGEAVLHAFLRAFLPRRRYRLLRDLTLPTADGSTQIDHVVVSRHGVFVIETKNYRGWIFGAARDKTWTQQIYRHRSTFQNPLRQNYKHVRALAQVAGVDRRALFPLVVFVGTAVIKTPMPANVTNPSGCLAAIRRRTELLLGEDEVERIVDALRAGRLAPSRATAAAHARHVAELVAARRRLQQAMAALPAPPAPVGAAPPEPAATPCPRCGGGTATYTYRSGPKAGLSFRGCTRFPACTWRVELPAAATAAS